MPYFQLTQAATTPSGSHRTSLTLYIIKKFVGRFSALSAFSPCAIVHFSFSAVTKISPNDASIRVFPESRHAATEIASWLSRMYLTHHIHQPWFGRDYCLSPILQEGPQNRSSLPEARFSPLELCLGCLQNRSVDAVCCGWVYQAQRFAIRRTVALYRT